MRLQKATRFALYAALEFAARPNEYVSAAEVAGKYGVSLNHLAKVLQSKNADDVLDMHLEIHFRAEQVPPLTQARQRWSRGKRSRHWLCRGPKRWTWSARPRLRCSR